MASGKEQARSPGAGRRFKRRQVKLAEGGVLALRADGSIEQTDAAGEITGTWATGDPGWARHAIRFGLHPQPETVAPHGRREPDPRPQAG
ncbi:MAG: hypothetical protein ABSG37_01770 [Candidatus Limnocylindrales bacterium]